MPLPISFLIGSPRRLVGAIVLFVVLDLTVLITNLWIAAQLAQDAVAINLAGRQRMLSQQATKALLLTTHAPDEARFQAGLNELAAAYGLFERTLRAFTFGGETLGGDGSPVMLAPVGVAEGRAAVAAALKLVVPLSAMLGEFRASGQLSPGARQDAMEYMVRYNHEILAQMNRLTTALEHDSVSRATKLRVIQTGAFLLALANFLVIVLGLIRQYKHVASDRHRWREIAQHDALTGLLNRAALRVEITATLAAAKREKRPFSLLMLDLDGFKPINDRYGHAAGDKLLIALAARLSTAARESDVVARLGGDEFAILCPHLHSRDHLRQFCDRVLAAIADIACEETGARCQVAASIGVAVCPDHGGEVDELLVAADRAMYAAKFAGGGRWQLAAMNC